MTAKDLGLPFGVSLTVWGAHYAGDASEQDACLAERSPACGYMWDKTALELLSFRRWHGWRLVPVPDWWAFSYLSTAEMDFAFEIESIEEALNG